MKNIDWESIVQEFQFFKIEHAGEKRQITSHRMTRLGLELSGFFARKKTYSTILFGNEEYLYLKSFSEDERKARIFNTPSYKNKGW